MTKSQVWLWDGEEWFDKVYDDPTSVGLKEGELGCWQVRERCDGVESDDYLWADYYHPSKMTSRLVVKEVEELIKGSKGL